MLLFPISGGLVFPQVATTTVPIAIYKILTSGGTVSFLKFNYICFQCTYPLELHEYNCSRTIGKQWVLSSVTCVPEDHYPLKNVLGYNGCNSVFFKFILYYKMQTVLLNKSAIISPLPIKTAYLQKVLTSCFWHIPFGISEKPLILQLFGYNPQTDQVTLGSTFPSSIKRS